MAYDAYVCSVNIVACFEIIDCSHRIGSKVESCVIGSPMR